MRVALDTHGCRLNQSESDAMAEALVRAGQLRALSSAFVAARHHAAAGRTADGVVHLRPRGDGTHEGLTDDDLRLELPSDAGAAWAGRRVTVQLADDGRRVLWSAHHGA